MHLVLIETSGNQRYIFATNKLRENVGASELTHRAGTQWVLEEVARQGGPRLWDSNARKLREKLLDPSANAPIEDEGVQIEVLVATSGKALLLVKDPNMGSRLISAVTAKAQRAAPGLDICGVVGESFEWSRDLLNTENRRIHEAFEQVRANQPGPDFRFQRLPVVAECATSGFPAAKWVASDREMGGAVSQISIQKRAAHQQTHSRVQALIEEPNLEGVQRAGLAQSIRQMEENLENLSWLAVVHTDGNGLGEIFLNFARPIGATEPRHNRQYIDKYRRFSISLDMCTEKAFQRAWIALQRPGQRDNILPVVVLVLGGDDMTVICDGATALPFTEQFLRAFEEETQGEQPLVGRIAAEIAKGSLGEDRLSACAGVAIIKPHFPFWQAYSLAEELIRSAKMVKRLVKKDGRTWPCSSIDFHVLYDTSNIALNQIRSKLVLDAGQTRLFGRPYVVTEALKLTDLDPASTGWLKCRHWEDLQRKVDILAQADPMDPTRRLLPNSQTHALRSGLFEGKNAADVRFHLVAHRYPMMSQLEGVPGSLFWAEASQSEGGLSIWVTGLLDAIEATGFMQKEDET